MIDITVIITTYQEAKRLPACMTALKDFAQVIVVDTPSDDGTEAVAAQYRAEYIPYQWNGHYPKKRQWCLENLDIRHDYVFWVDADEIVTQMLIEELTNHPLDKAGYFVKGHYCWNGKILKFGFCNKKLALFRRDSFEFPVVDDLTIEGMGEIEGHYQPVLKALSFHEDIGALKQGVIHHAQAGWEERHRCYAAWEAEMIRRDAYPKDPVVWREILKRIYRRLPLRGAIAFAHSYIFTLGFLDGKAGLDFAVSRHHYYKMVSAALKTSKKQAHKSAGHKPNAAPL